MDQKTIETKEAMNDTNIKTIGLCLTVYNRPTIILDAIRWPYLDKRISHIYISDDCSTQDNYEAMLINLYPYRDKITVQRNPSNVGVYRNKFLSVEMAQEEYVIVFDSDNIMDETYIDAIYSQTWWSSAIHAPCYAKPSFDYRSFAGPTTYYKEIVGEYCNKPLFDCLLNTMNYFVHRESFIKVWQPWDVGISQSGADSIHFNRLWLESGRRIHVVSGMEYLHRTFHSKEAISNYVNFAKDSQPVCEQELELIRNMK